MPGNAAECYDFLTVDPQKSDPATGTAVHRAIREQVGAYLRPQYGPRVSVRLPDASFDHYRDALSLVIGGKRKGEGDVDLAFRSPAGKTMLLAEIKPANWLALVAGEWQLGNYIDKANENNQMKRAYGVTGFSKMRQDLSPLPPLIFAEGRSFEIRWCSPGLLLYKEVRKKRDQDSERNRQPQRAERGAPARESSKAPAVAWPSWTPQQLRRDITAGALEDGLYRNRYQAAWPSGESTNVVVQVRTNATWEGLYRDVEFYQEFPSGQQFYDRFARRRGLSAGQADLIRQTMTGYNRDLWSLIAPDPVTGRSSDRSIEYARDELRTIYSQLLRGVFEASALLLTTGAGATSVANAAAQRGLSTPRIDPNARSIPARDAPLPGWVSTAVQKGADLFKKVEQEMRALQ